RGETAEGPQRRPGAPGAPSIRRRYVHATGTSSPANIGFAGLGKHEHVVEADRVPLVVGNRVAPQLHHAIHEVHVSRVSSCLVVAVALQKELMEILVSVEAKTCRSSQLLEDCHVHQVLVAVLDGILQLEEITMSEAHLTAKRV